MKSKEKGTATRPLLWNPFHKQSHPPRHIHRHSKSSILPSRLPTNDTIPDAQHPISNIVPWEPAYQIPRPPNVPETAARNTIKTALAIPWEGQPEHERTPLEPAKPEQFQAWQLRTDETQKPSFHQLSCVPWLLSQCIHNSYYDLIPRTILDMSDLFACNVQQRQKDWVENPGFHYTANATTTQKQSD